MTPAEGVRIGISGWQYPGWRGDFYPEGLVRRRELEYAARQFRTIELNDSFYSLQRRESFERWAAETPDDFVFAVKGSRYITHMKRLTEIEDPLANFFAQGILRLGEKLGPILWQLPPNFKYDAGRLEHFFAMLPKTHKQASSLAKRHDHRLDGRTWYSSRIHRQR
jgi:uncharacterized protein YecE (DUF72 family)